MTHPSHVAVEANLTIEHGQVKSQCDGPEPMCPARLRAIRPSRSACASGTPTRLGVSAFQNAVRFGRTSEFDLHPLRQIKTPLMAAFLFGGGRSLMQTRLQPKFPANREKYREFHTFWRF